MNLFLDDCRLPHKDHKFHVVRNYEEFQDFVLSMGVPTLVSLDHDLTFQHLNDFFSEENMEKPEGDRILNYSSYDEKTGYHALCWLIEHCVATDKELPEIYIHTMNTVGASNMVFAIKACERYRQKAIKYKVVSCTFWE